ncbi:MAG: TRAP transporter substrate-binding protein [Pseudomonadota bacterium]
MLGRTANWLIGALVTVLLVFAYGPGYCAKTVTLTYSIFFPASHAHTLLATEWAAEVEKRTNGAVKISMFPGGTLTPADQCYDGVVRGISDVGMSVVSYTMGRFPLTEVIDLPLAYTSGIQATRLSNAYFEKFKPKEFDAVKMMYMHAFGPGLVHTSSKPVKIMDDLKGLKIRCSGTSAKVVAALGAAPVAMPQTEVYDALQKGIVEGVVCPIEALKGFRLTEVTKYTTQNYGSAYSLVFFVAMNKKKWDSLPKDVQETIGKINQEWSDKTGHCWDRIDKEAKEISLAKGHEFISLSKEEDARWAEKVKPIMAEYVAAQKAKNLPGEEALNFCIQWLKNNP